MTVAIALQRTKGSWSRSTSKTGISGLSPSMDLGSDGTRRWATEPSRVTPAAMTSQQLEVFFVHQATSNSKMLQSKLGNGSAKPWLWSLVSTEVMGRWVDFLLLEMWLQLALTALLPEDDQCQLVSIRKAGRLEFSVVRRNKMAEPHRNHNSVAFFRFFRFGVFMSVTFA